LQTKSEKAENVKLLAEKRAKRSAREQLAELDRRLGIGKGAKKERKRLLTQVG
jgi:hypothetical protein